MGNYKGEFNILIGIADTEFETTHEDLQGKFASVRGLSSAGHFHGTAVSSVAAARTDNGIGIASIGYNSRVAAHRVVHTITPVGGFDADPHNVEIAIWNLYLAGVKIINVSLTGTGLSRLKAEEITQNGTTLVLAAGNKSTDEFHKDIADIPGVIVVSSVNKDNKHGPTGHARNQWVDICAPGTDIRVAIDGSNYYSTRDGTSYAAPFVSGTIALMLSVNPLLTPAQIEHVLKSTASPIADASSFSGKLGAGRLNAHLAVHWVAPRIEGPDVISSCQPIYTLHNFPFPLSQISNPQWSCGPGLVKVDDYGINGAKFKCTVDLTTSPNLTTIYFSYVYNGTPYTISKTVSTHELPVIIGIMDLKEHYSVSTASSCSSYYFMAAPYHGTPYYTWKVYMPPPFAGPMLFEGQTTEKLPMGFSMQHEYTIELNVQDACGTNLTVSQNIWARDDSPCNDGGIGGPQPPCPLCFEIIFSPNPVDDELNIVFQHLPISTSRTQTTIYSVKLYDNFGNIFRQSEFTHTDNINSVTQRNSRTAPVKFNVSNLREGTYYLHVEGNGKVEKIQIIVKR